jgi:4-hydroxy-tetrahydrodipicolinate synthase
MIFPRLMTAMVTPFGPELEVDYEQAARLAEYLYENGSDGLVVSGTTGESPVLSDEEKSTLFQVVQDKVGNKIQVWAGTGSNDTRHSIKLSREAEKAGVAGVMLVTPYYNRPSQEGLYQHFKQIAESISIPVMLYNVPSRTGVNLLPQTVERLVQIENIVALKEASGDMDQMSLLSRLSGDSFRVYSGDDSLTLPMMALGAYGVVSVASHVVGRQIREMINSYYDGDIAKALNIHQYLFPIYKGLFVASNPIPVKEALNILGMQVGGFRPPLTSLPAKEKEFVEGLVKKYVPGK